ncbi:alpha-amylase family glycosyl hydrolase [Deinococcus sp. RM]|uniref:alpha-amylase family glycosyl hydrolase n=1 Tax=Deinococcus sp. RM TaxID=2316359 RepID=UPI000E6A5A32|nr:alpha-amylase family glycosyl hydrolase [Deinococcus sp. RM]RIY06494.1 starch-binding protein [Deinococcus sp. RM]
MSKIKLGFAGTLAVTSFLLAGCGVQKDAAIPINYSNGDSLHSQALPATDWRKEVLYFALTDRFANGNTSNDNGNNNRAGDAKDLGNPMGWHGGDFAGLRQKIESGYFSNLGVTAIWISPVTLQVPAVMAQSGPNSGKYHAGYAAYWTEDFFQVEPHFGNLQDLKDLVNAAHAKGLRVVQDMVLNHAGYEAQLARQKPSWFYKGSCINDQKCSLDGLPDFDQDNSEVKQYLNDSVNYWVSQTGIDGIRMDTIKHVNDSYWPQFFAAGGPGDASKVWTVGEAFTFDPGYINKYLNLGSPSMFDFPLYGALRDSLGKRGSLDGVANVLANTSYSDSSRLTTFLDNHDVRRFMSEGIENGIPFNEQRERLDAALSLQFTVRGTPSVYYGTEIAMQGKGDPYNNPSGQTNREDMNFSAASTSPLVTRIKALSDARRANPALTNGAHKELWRPNGGANLYAFARTLSGEASIVTVVNGSDGTLDLGSLGGISVSGLLSSGSVTELTGRTNTLSVNSSGKLVGTVPARTVLIVKSGGTPPPANCNPTALSGQGSSTSATVNWTAPSGCTVTGYNVYSKGSGSPTYTRLTSTPLSSTATGYTASNLATGSYDFKVTTLTSDGKESAGVEVTGVQVGTPAGLTVHFKKPTAWGGANIHHWNASPTGAVTDSTWPGKTMTAETVGCGWYKYTLPGVSSTNLLFVDPSATTRKTADLSRAKEGWFDGTTNTWSDTQPACDPITTTTKVTFQVTASTTLGQNVFLVGDVTELKAWDTANALSMTPSGCSGSTCTWTSAPIELKSNAGIQFKFIKKSGSSVSWEGGSNRTYTVPATGTASYNGGSWR